MSHRRLLRAAIFGAFFLLMTATAFAQTPEAGPEPGLCAPWHRCLAFGLLAMTLLACAAWGAGYAIQRKGFDKLQHRQGTPGGVKVEE